jgi:hypothetical protein
MMTVAMSLRGRRAADDVMSQVARRQMMQRERAVMTTASGKIGRRILQ